jgi:hypothetical protein
MAIKYYKDLVQGSDEWLSARCGLLTASEMKHIITPTYKVASNDKERAHLYELVAQRITKYVEPSYISDDMMRGREDEIEACILYSEKYSPVQDMGFITNDKFGFTIGFSPDGLVKWETYSPGFIEVKSRRQKYQMETILSGEMPSEYMIQIQTGLLVSELKWCDFISYCGGMPMFVTRILPDEKIQEAIVEAAMAFEKKAAEKVAEYQEKIKGLWPTERKVEQEIII